MGTIIDQDLARRRYQVRSWIIDIDDEKRTTIIQSTNSDRTFTQRDLRLLLNDVWLNDQIIDAYLGLVVERSRSEAGWPCVFAMSALGEGTLGTGDRHLNGTKKVRT